MNTMYICSSLFICSHMEEKHNLIYKIAREYYERNHTQQQIARRFGISRIMVSRLLQKAIDERIVEIHINPPQNPYYQLENKLEDRYDLTEAIVTTGIKGDYQKTLNEIGKKASVYLFRYLQGNEKISISWGETLLSMINHLPAGNFPEVQIIQMIGGLGFPYEEISGTDLTRRMANTLNAKARILDAPGIVKTREVCRELMHYPQIKGTLNLARQADIAIVGIGQFSDNSFLIRSNTILTQDDISVLKENKAVGDICLRFFDEKGKTIRNSINDRVIGLTMEEIKAIPRVIVIAGGESKRIPVKAALQSNIPDILITDHLTAEYLLQN